MKALRVHQNGAPVDVLRLEDVDVPTPGPGRALLRVEAASLNLPDALLCLGTYAMKPPMPFTPGLDAGGIIEAVGPDVDPGLVGRRVSTVADLPHGSLAEYAIVKPEGLFVVPENVELAKAVGAQIVFQTAHLALHHRGRVRPGETVLVLGAGGGVGTASIQLAVLAGARVIAVVGGADKVLVAERLGAETVIDHQNIATTLSEAVLQATDGRGVDVVVDPVGGDAFEEARRCTAVDGRILIVGFASGDTQRVSAGVVLRGSIDLIGVYVGAYSRSPEGRALLDSVHNELMDLLASGDLEPVVDRVVGLDGVAAAMTDLVERRVIGKVIVDPRR